MKVILDECLPRRLLRDIEGHPATTVPRQGWAGIQNGELLGLVEKEFDVFVTMDSNMLHQQKNRTRSFCLIVLHATSSRYEALLPLVGKLNEAISSAEPGIVVHLRQPYPCPS